MKVRSVLLVFVLLLILLVTAAPVLADDRPGRLAGEITALDAAAGTFTLKPRFRDPVTVQTSDDTEFYRRVRRHGYEPITFDDLAVGDRVRVRGTMDGDKLNAAKVILVPPPPPHPHLVHGSIAALDADAGTLSVQPRHGDAVLVKTTADTKFFRTLHHGRLEPIAFADLAVGDRVKVLGTRDGEALNAWVVTVLPSAPPPPPRLVHGHIAELDADAGTIKVERRHGDPVMVQTSTDTRFYRQARWGRLESITFADLVVGERVAVLGTWDGEAEKLNALRVLVMRGHEGEADGVPVVLP